MQQNVNITSSQKKPVGDIAPKSAGGMNSYLFIFFKFSCFLKCCTECF